MKPLDTQASEEPVPETTSSSGDAARPAALDTVGQPLWSIGELAAQLKVSTRTIRFYEQRHLITPERAKGARVYGRRDRARMQLILRGKNLGFTLDVIREYLTLYDADPDQVTQTQMFLEKVDSSIADLESKKVDIERTLEELKALQVRAAAFLRDRQ
jgi:DNA-binding transcriptional MerR regulator